ncbi:MAG: cyclic nucleotide-binding domain-containing protein [Candidatus Cloacimonadaceae bacterium]
MFWTKLTILLDAHLHGHSKYDYLRNFPLLCDFTNLELFLFSQIVQTRNFKQGEFIYQEEFPLAVIYLILDGAIELKEGSDRNAKTIILEKHQLLGVIDLYTETRRKGVAAASKDSVLLAVSHLDFNAFIKTNPRTGIKLLNNVCRIISCQYVELQSSALD